MSDTMKKLLEEQNSIGQQIDKALENLSKLEMAKRTEETYLKKLDEMESWWEKFKANHDILEFSKDIEPTHKYFVSSHFMRVMNCKRKYELLLNNAISDLKNPNKGQQSGEGNSYGGQQANLDTLIASMERSVSAYAKYSDKEKTPQVVEGLLEQFKDEMTVLKQLHAQLLLNDPAYQAGDYIRVQEKVGRIIQSLNSSIPTHINNERVNNNTRMGDNMKLPKISLPKFDGDYLKWMNFQELFTQMIGATNISGTQKLMYLKQNVTGEAAALLQHLQVSEANYTVAWQALINRYHNPRLIFSALLAKILKMEAIRTESANGLRKMHDTLKECSNALDSIVNVQGGIEWREYIFHFIALEKLDSHSHALYEQTVIDAHQIQKLPQLLEFLEKRFQALEAIYGKGSKGSQSQHQQHQQKEKKHATALVASSNTKNTDSLMCECKEKHMLYKCPKFLALSIGDRYKSVKSSRRCINCLKTGHMVKECKSRNCTQCSKKHNGLLHFESKTALLSSTINNKNIDHVFLATVIINVMDKNDNPVKIRALLDSGSQINIMTEKVQRRIGISTHPTIMRINGVGAAGILASKRSMIKIKSEHSGFSTQLEAFIVKQMTTCQPASLVDVGKWNIPKNVALADPAFNVPAQIDLIIGGELFYKLLSIGLISIGPNLPDLQNTVFGWVVIGKLLGLETNEVFSGIVTNEMLSNKMTKFWEVEERYQSTKPLTNAEQDCEQYFMNTTYRQPRTGKFVVKLQFTKEPAVLGLSEEMAIKRFLFLERRFAKNPDMKNEYVKFMREYESLNHMEEIPKQHLPDKFYVIPHHFVTNPGSSTTKFRVVFDASAKTTNNISINEILANGPMLQDDLFSIMVRFRKHQYVFSADVGKMYGQILVAPEDQKWQMIVWRENPNAELKYYKLKTLTYGTTCASYLAIKSLQQLADEEQDAFPLASVVAKRDFNVDDVMTGTDDINEAIKLQQELINMLKLAGLDLHKWCANDPMLVENIATKKHDVSLDINGEKTETKALGMKWIPRTDMFMLHYNQRDHQKVTKRTVLSETAQLFDPLGLVNPVIVLAKIFLQELWSLKLDWDEALPMELHTKWINFRQELTQLNKVAVHRHIIIENAVNVQLHAFSDASTRAYGAVFYIRSENEKGEVMVSLVCSKSRVAPVSATTLPRLELCAAVLISDMAEKLQKILEINFDKITYWTDSEVVLSWIFTNGSYKTFVANRVASIIRKSEVTNWRYINTKVNPADLISRGLTPEKLLQSQLWWNGPQFLKLGESEWPKIKPAFVREESEERAIKTVLSAAIDDHVIDRINHHNSINTLKRVVAYCRRFANKSKDNPKSTALTVMELKESMQQIIRHCQSSAFAEELKLIKNGSPEKCQFSSLAPIIGNDGILRVGGRIQASNIPFEQKHPALLPKDHYITRLILERIHIENYHAGAQAMLAIIRQQYWPVNGKRAAQAIVKNCAICVRSKPKLMEQLMGNLPAERINIERPFINVGVDYAGPITIHYKIRGKRPTKAYICIFVCFVTKAVHIEVAANLTTAAFISCIKRFIARRGRPNKIFSDNATNFVGANNQLKELAGLMQKDEHKEAVQRYCSDHLIEWKFIPPRSPHFAGLVEAAVKSAKLHLVKVLHNIQMTFDELATVLAEIEAILNSRPLTPMSNDPNDLQPLTAGHFLIGEAMNAIHDEAVPHASSTEMWRKIKTVRKNFWERWSKEYLAELQYRHKWTKDQRNVQIGQLVIVKEDNIPPLDWRMARVTATATDDSGKVRVVELQTRHGVRKRAIHQICPLPVEPVVEPSEQIVKFGNIAIQENKKTSKLQASAAEFVPKKQHGKAAKIGDSLSRGIPGRNVRSGVFPENSGVIPKENNQKTKKKQIPAKENCSGETIDEQWTSRLRSRNYKATNDNGKKNWNFRPMVNQSNLVIMGILLFSMMIGAFAEEPCPVKKFKHNPGLYYEDIGQISLTSDDWEIKCHLSMKEYWAEENSIKTILSQLETICPECHPKEYCNTTIMQLEHQLSTLQLKNELIHGFSSDQLRDKRSTIGKLLARKRRGWFNGFGVAGKEVFGLLDADDGEKFEAEIKETRINNEHMMELIKNQSTIQDITRNIIKRNEALVKTQLDHILHEIRNIHQKDTIGKMSVFTSLSLQAIELMAGYRDVQSAILGILTHLHHGRVPAMLITPNQMRRQLLIVTSHIAHDKMIPGDDQSGNLAKLYTMLTTKVRLTKDNLLIVVKLPLISREYFKLYHILPVPFMYEDRMSAITPSVKYIGVNLKQDHYYLVSEMDKAACQRYSERQIICKQNHPLYSVQGTNTVCEMAVILHPKSIPEKCTINIIKANQTWSKLVAENQYLFSMAAQTSVNLICGTNIQSCYLNDSGILSLDPQCTLKGGSLEISSSNVFSSQNAAILIPPSNITSTLMTQIRGKWNPNARNELTDWAEIEIDPDSDPELKTLEDAIRLQKQNTHLLKSYKWHSMHHYVSFYSAVIVIMIFLSYKYFSKNQAISKACLLQRCKRNPRRHKGENETAARFDSESHRIEMDEMFSRPAPMAQANTIIE